MSFIDWLNNKPRDGYREVALSEVLDVLKQMGYRAIESMTVDELIIPTGRAGIPGMGGGYTPLGMYKSSSQPEKVVYIKRGKIFEQVVDEIK